MPIDEPMRRMDGSSAVTVRAANATSSVMRNTTVECPSEKKKPTPSGRRSGDMSFRVVLSMAAMWSASNAWRRPNEYARPARPMRNGYRRA